MLSCQFPAAAVDQFSTANNVEMWLYWMYMCG